jgi:hypothetical protein
VLLIQSIPYAASLLMSLVSAFPFPAKLLGVSPHNYQSTQPGMVPVSAQAAMAGVSRDEGSGDT